MAWDMVFWGKTWELGLQLPVIWALGHLWALLFQPCQLQGPLAL